jgi:uncharacterized membrane protein YczE
MTRRSVFLFVGLALYGFSLTLLLRADLGLDPWDVFHQGVADTIGVPLGLTIVATSALVLMCWIPLRERPGIGTIANALLVGLGVELFRAVLPETGNLTVRIVLVAAGIILNGVATGMYIGARFGPGPRDGLMTGIARRGPSIRVVRTSIEIVVLTVGFALGGTVGVATIAYAVAIGPLAHVFIPRFSAMTAAEPADRPRARC